MSERERMRKAAELAEEQWHKADAGPLPLVSVHWAQYYATDVPHLLDALEASEARCKEREEA